MISGANIDDLHNTGVLIIGYRQVFNRVGTREILIDIIRRYPFEEWLNLLCRIQSIVAADGEGLLEVQVPLAQASLGSEVMSAIKNWVATDGRKIPKSVLFHEHQIGLLQQLCFTHAPQNGDGVFIDDSARNDFGIALLIANDLIALNDQPTENYNMIGVGIVNHFRSLKLTSWQAYARAIQFYQFDLPDQSEACKKLLEDFATATGVNGKDYILGGQCLVMDEAMRTTEDHMEAWHGVKLSTHCPSPREKECRAAFEAVRMADIGLVKQTIEQIERGSEPEYTLIPLSKFPLLRLDEQRAVVLSRSALGRALFDGVRHAVLAHCQTRADRNRAIQLLGSTYGYIFEDYVGRLLRDCFSDRVLRIPHERFPGCADYVILYPDKVLVIECKSGHFLASDKYRLRPLADWQHDIKEKIKLGDAVEQIANAIQLLRSNRRAELDPTLSSFNFENSVFVPVVITDEDLPFPITGWDELYAWFDVQLRAACPDVSLVSRVRLVPIDEVEWLIDIEGSIDIASTLMRWAHDDRRYGFTLKNFLLSHGFSIGRRHAVENYGRTVQYLAREFGLEVDLRTPDLPVASA